MLDTLAGHNESAGLDPGATCLLVVNDDFGALALSTGAPAWTDSWLSAEATRRNAALNELPEPVITFLTEPTPLPARGSSDNAGAPPAVILLRVPKQLALLEWQLATLAPLCPEGTRLLAAAMDKHLPASTLDVMDHYWGETTRHRAVGKARLLSSTRRAQPVRDLPDTSVYFCPELQGELVAGPNVFSRENLDIGSRYLLEYLRSDDAPARVQSCLDLACGNGVLGLAALRWQLAGRVIFCDESAQAIESARENGKRLFPYAGDRVIWCHGDGALAYNGPPVDLVLCNPPFHMGHSVEEHVGRRLLQQASRVLRPGGQLLAVTNRHLDYGPGLRRSFEQVERVAGNRKFTIWSART